MKYVLYTLKYGETGVPVLMVIHYHYDCDVIVIDQIGGHGVCLMTGLIGENVINPDLEITNSLYNRCLLLLAEAGIC